MRVPKFRKNGDGRAFAVIPNSGGKRSYFGKYGDPEAYRAYCVWLGQWALKPDAPKAGEHTGTIGTLIEQYLDWAEGEYSRQTAYNINYAINPFSDLFGDEPARDIKPAWLLAFQQYLIDQKRYRKVINDMVGRVRHFVQWCCLRGLLPDDRYHALLAVPNLRKGHPRAIEGEDVKPVEYVHVLAVKPFLPPHLWAMIELQRLCGMRPQDVCRMRPCDVDTSGDIWLYKPHKHKTANQGKKLIKAIPQVAQELLRPFLDRDPAAYCFSPKEVQAWRFLHTPAYQGRERKAKIYPSELRRREKQKAERVGKPARSRGKRDHYGTASYRKAIEYAFKRAEKAKVKFERWHPHQLRHAISTEISQMLGEQASQRWLGHAHLSTTGIYTEVQVKELIAIARSLDAVWSKPPAPTDADAP